MAEYIDKKYLDRKFQVDMMCLWGGTMIESKEIIDSLPTADVIERSEHDKVVQTFKALIEIKNGMYHALEGEYAELKANINKAIEEMEQLKHKNTDIEGYRWWNNAIENVLHILKEI